jgi:hypothetical protein
MFRRGLLVATLVAAVLVPVASASAGRAHRVKLSLVPLPKSALGAAGRSLQLSHDSGVVTNADAAGNASTATAKTFQQLGRVTGYGLTYGDPFSGRAGVTQIGTGVEEYKTAADAKKGLAFWRKDDATITSLKQFGVSVTLKVLKAPAVGKSRFGYGTTFTVPGVAPIALADERVADGRYVLQVSDAAASLAAASRAASKLMRSLDQRLLLAEAGRLRAKPVKLLPPPKAGPPRGGPDLAALGLTATDLTGTATIGDSSYVVDPSALSAYVRDMNPAGQYHDLTQEIEWYATANEATVVTTLAEALAGSELASLIGVSATSDTPVDLSSVGDNGRANIFQFSVNGQSLYVAVVALSRGQASDFVLATSDALMQASDVQSLAQAMATHLDAGVTG